MSKSKPRNVGRPLPKLGSDAGMPLASVLGAKMRGVRTGLGIGLDEVRDLTGIPKSRLEKIEGGAEPKAKEVIAYAGALDCRVSLFFQGLSEPPVPISPQDPRAARRPSKTSRAARGPEIPGAK